MLKRFMTTTLAMLILAASTLIPNTAHAAGNWYFLSVCVGNVPIYCSPNAAIWYFGPYSSVEVCNQAWWQVQGGWMGQFPWALSSCWEE